ncbi:MAG: hypothetical protein KME30_25110 [Iphinoe sp. HA4291-MV1]|jgi:GGDEF domain-containing protein|nr:hypothetical protein [Iphinoe sp. HA4291-MV1]
MNQVSCVVEKTASYQVNQLLTSLLQENKLLREKLEKAYTNSNFGCYNRAGAEVRGNEFLQHNRRRAASGQLVMVCCDVIGMGKRNNDVGEEAVNKAIATALAEIRQWRGVEFISQLNSGDEFVFVVDKVDVEGIVPRMDAVFRCHGFEGIYGAVVRITGCYITSANNGMDEVYKQKNKAVCRWKDQLILYKNRSEIMLRIGDVVINLNAIAYVDLEANSNSVTKDNEKGVRIYLLSNGSTSNLASLFFQGDDAHRLQKYFLKVGELCGYMEQGE